jgi:hypothetical protein
MGMLTLLTLSVLLASCSEEALQVTPDWSEVIQDHLERYPDMELDDLYKLLHQGATGSEHAVGSAEAARKWLEDELATLGAGPAEPLVDTIAPDGAHVRVHLRPFLQSGGDPEALLQAFVETANTPPASTEGLASALDAALDMAREGLLPWNVARVEAHFDDLEAAGYPAVHHSVVFGLRYGPAYRVVSGTLLGDLFPPR